MGEETKMNEQVASVKRLEQLHHAAALLVLPNIWDVIGARLLEKLGYPAVATASAAIAFSQGFDDGEQMPFSDLLSLLKKITAAVHIPVTADIESGYAESDAQLKENIRQLIDCGIAGINIEDTLLRTNTLRDIDAQCHRIDLIKNTALQVNGALFINARTDVYVHDTWVDSSAKKFEEAVKRALAYKSAGADCFFPLALCAREEIKRMVEKVSMPVSILLIKGVPELKTLQEMKVARISLGPGFLRTAISAMKRVALKLRVLEGSEEITEKEVTSDYLKTLIAG